MKKIVAIVNCLLLSILLTSCKKTENESVIKTNSVIKWFDCYNGDKLIWDSFREYNLDEFQGVTFRCDSGSLTAVTEKEIKPLYFGMPIWSVYFYDLTGDGKPEICSSISNGSGIIDNRIIVYDYVNDNKYELSARGNFDYVLNVKDDFLIAEKRFYTKDEIIESGKLVYLNDAIQIQKE